MILYALACIAGHRFESWFRDSAAYDGQIARDLVACPTCHSTDVVKAIMAPAVVAGRTDPRPFQAATASPEEKTDEPSAPAARLDEGRDLREILRGLHQKLAADGDNVGDKFAVEARRIHDGEAPPRQIYGQASLAEARDLLEDGIAVMPIPLLPDALN